MRTSRGFNGWVLATVGSELGSGVLAFALTWTASGIGPQVASAVFTLTVAPSVALVLLSGAVADRFGPRRVMITGTLMMILISASLGVVVLLWRPSAVVLLLTAALIGTVAAFQRPATGVFPRLFVSDVDLGAAMARVGMASQFARVVAPPAGGLLVGVIALSGVASDAGFIEAGWIAGGLVCGAWFAWRGTAAKVSRPMAVGPLIIAVGLGFLATASEWNVALFGTTLIGVGVVMFTAHVFPTYLLLAPSAMISRFHALLILVQQAPQLVIGPLIGSLVAVVGTAPVLAMSGLAAALAALIVLTDTTLRSFTTSTGGANP